MYIINPCDKAISLLSTVKLYLMCNTFSWYVLGLQGRIGYSYSIYVHLPKTYY